MISNFTKCLKDSHSNLPKDFVCSNKFCKENGFICAICLKAHKLHQDCTFNIAEIVGFLKNELKESNELKRKYCILFEDIQTNIMNIFKQFKEQLNEIFFYAEMFIENFRKLNFEGPEKMVSTFQKISSLLDCDGKGCKFNLISLKEKLENKLKILRETETQLKNLILIEFKQESPIKNEFTATER